LIANNLRRGFLGWRRAETAIYIWIRQYIAIVTEIEIMAVICHFM
jgi:hypothetical protein